MTWSAAISAFLGAFLGGLVKQVFALISTRASRKILIIQKIEKQVAGAIEDLRTDATRYWCAEPADTDKELVASIYGKLELIHWLYQKLFETNEEAHRRIDLDFHRLRRAITGGDFAVKNRQSDESRAIDVETEAAKLASSIQIERSGIPIPWF